MTISTQLYKGQHVHLGPINYAKDAEIESRWTHNSQYLHSLGLQLARPLSPAQIKKRYEILEKEIEKSKNTFYFTIRSREEDQLLGFIRLFWIEWTNATGWIQIAIGNPEERGRAYAFEAFQLVLRFAFQELNLYRLSASTSEDDSAWIELYKKAGFIEEVRRRKAIQRSGQTCDQLLLGLLRNEWNARKAS